MKFHHVSIYVTCKDDGEAKYIGKQLLQDRLVACVNICGEIESLYWWQGEIQQAGETLLIAKTGKNHVETVISKIQMLHSYDNPCIVAFPIVYASADYLDWIDAETR